MKNKFVLRHAAGIVCVSAFAAITLGTPTLHAADGPCDTNANGNWNVVTNWVGNTDYACGADSTATLCNFIAANRDITLNTPITIGNISAADLTATYRWSKDLSMPFNADGLTDGDGTSVDFTTQHDTPATGNRDSHRIRHAGRTVVCDRGGDPELTGS
jgi:hypothetical protein